MKRQLPQDGFSLVEVTFALGVAAFCLVTVFALLPIGVNSNLAATEQTAATNLLTAAAADLRATANPAPGGTAQTSPVYLLAVPVSDGQATAVDSPLTSFISEDGRLVPAAGQARYLLSVWMTPPGANSREPTLARLVLTWPAPASRVKAAGSVESVVALNRN